jgi:hypothetical protein
MHVLWQVEQQMRALLTPTMRAWELWLQSTCVFDVTLICGMHVVWQVQQQMRALLTPAMRAAAAKESECGATLLKWLDTYMALAKIKDQQVKIDARYFDWQDESHVLSPVLSHMLP